jgi:hypothetical protein
MRVKRGRLWRRLRWENGPQQLARPLYYDYYYHYSHAKILAECLPSGRSGGIAVLWWFEFEFEFEFGLASRPKANGYVIRITVVQYRGGRAEKREAGEQRTQMGQ